MSPSIKINLIVTFKGLFCKLVRCVLLHDLTLSNATSSKQNRSFPAAILNLLKTLSTNHINVRFLLDKLLLFPASPFFRWLIYAICQNFQPSASPRWDLGHCLCKQGFGRTAPGQSSLFPPITQPLLPLLFTWVWLWPPRMRNCATY